MIDFNYWVALLLIMVRTTAFLVASPLFSLRNIPALVKVGLGVLLAFLLSPAVPKNLPETVELLDYVLWVANESLVGLFLGFLASLVFASLRVAGELADIQMGFGTASLLDPQNSMQVTLMGQFYHLLALLLFVLLNGHHQLLLALADSFRLVPLGQIGLKGMVALEVVKIFAGMFALAFRVAAPILAVLLMSDVALAMVARTVPQLNVFILGFPLKAGLGMLTASLIIPLLAGLLSDIFYQMEKDLGLIIRGLAP
ncbi:flagellar biosynthetic protein FliR [Calderihabitans maritimus]|uniref:Flagellar biosynthetic protein FliR n=1 Tax=Calderihabitans maritimus TaxID=1246530 RepID=A0A1Z5HTT5_9FIRM|nr:flagellar biosynthetic protein FliR [Calderihabitans maritimus]GAW92932.1 flagellar biosynthesis protein FliR [Calderihabitans maritimus]